MNVLVTGATGFVGTPVVKMLLAEGHAVNYLARKRATGMDTRAAFFCWNPDEEEVSLAGMGRLDAVVHLAGEPIMQRWSANVRKKIRDSRVLGTKRLVAAISNLKHRPAALVSASAIGFYGDRGDEILTESSAKGSGFLADLCAEWEREAFAAQEFGMRAAAIRIGLVLGANGGALKQMLPVFRAGLGGRLGSGRQWMSWIGLDDLVRLFIFAAANDNVAGVVNGTSPQPVTNAEFTKTLATVLRRPALFAVPAAALKLAYGELGAHLLDSARVLPKAAEVAGFELRERELKGCLKQAVARARRTEQ